MSHWPNPTELILVEQPRHRHLANSAVPYHFIIKSSVPVKLMMWGWEKKPCILTSFFCTSSHVLSVKFSRSHYMASYKFHFTEAVWAPAITHMARMIISWQAYVVFRLQTRWHSHVRMISEPVRVWCSGPSYFEWQQLDTALGPYPLTETWTFLL
jgi:hypothetical protein